MRCGCPDCGAYMVHSEGPAMGCVCPECGTRCRDCLGTDTLISRESLARLKSDPAFLATYLSAAQRDAQADEAWPPADDWPDD